MIAQIPILCFSHNVIHFYNKPALSGCSNPADKKMRFRNYRGRIQGHAVNN